MSVVFAFHRDGESAGESAVLSPPVPLEVLRALPLAGSVLDAAERFPGRPDGPIHVSLPPGMEPRHVLAVLAGDVYEDVLAARDYLCIGAPLGYEERTQLLARMLPERQENPRKNPRVAALVALISSDEVSMVTVTETTVLGVCDDRELHMYKNYDFYHAITWKPTNIKATLRTTHLSPNTPSSTLLDGWCGGFFTEPIPSTYLLMLHFSEKPESITCVGSLAANGRRPHRRNVCTFRCGGKTYYAAQDAIVPSHPLELGWWGSDSPIPPTVSVMQLMYGPLQPRETD
jgi:hypothetical protein